jgi:hypothetical protein
MKYKILAFIINLGLIPFGHITGQTNGALYMSTYYKYASVENINVSGFSGLTIEGWCNMDQYMPFGDATGNPIFVKEATFSSPYYNYGFILMVLNEQHYQGHDRRLAFGLNFGTNGETHIGLHSNSEVPLNEWHHLAGTWDGVNMKVYIDGVLDGTYDVSSLGAIYDPDSVMHFGARMLGNQYAFQFGDIDDARIWNYARTESEIRESMYKELSGAETGLYACYKFNETSGQILTDSGINGLDGYLGATSGGDVYDAARVSSTAPIPYYTVQNGSWEDAATWAAGQSAPFSNWARAAVVHTVNINSDVMVEGLTVEPGGSCAINPGKSLTVNGDLINDAGNSGIFIKSDATGTGSLIEHNGVSATVERYLTDSCWHYISAPVDDPLAGVFLGMYLKTWDEPAGTWIDITDENEVLATDMAGYALWTYHTDTAVFTGVLNAGSKTLNVTHQGTATDTIDDGYNFAGNPYPSSLDWNADDGSGWTRTAGNVYNTLWIWNPAFGNYGVYIKDAVTGTNDVDNIIPPHQGFFVFCSQLNGYISVNDSARIHGSKDIYKSGDQAYSLLKLKVVGGYGSDETILSIQPEASASYESQTDALKMRGYETAPQFYTLSKDNRELSINSFPESEDYRVIPLCLGVGMPGEYMMTVSTFSGFDPSDNIFLEDLKENVFTKIEDENMSYSFSSDPLDQPGRFLLHFTGGMNVPEPQTGLTSLNVYSFGHDIFIKSEKGLSGTVRIFDITGRELKADKLYNEFLIKLNLTGQTGHMIVNIVADQGVINRKVYLR